MIDTYYGKSVSITKPNSSSTSGEQVSVTDYRLGNSYLANLNNGNIYQDIEKASAITTINNIKFISFLRYGAVGVYVTYDNKIIYSMNYSNTSTAPTEDTSWPSVLSSNGKTSVDIKTILIHYDIMYIILVDGTIFLRHSVVSHDGSKYFLDTSNQSSWSVQSQPSNFSIEEVTTLWSVGIVKQTNGLYTNLFVVPKPIGQSNRFITVYVNNFINVYEEITFTKGWTDGVNPTGVTNPTTVDELLQNYHLVHTMRIGYSPYSVNAIFEHKENSSIRLTYNFENDFVLDNQNVSGINTMLSSLGNRYVNSAYGGNVEFSYVVTTPLEGNYGNSSDNESLPSDSQLYVMHGQNASNGSFTNISTSEFHNGYAIKSNPYSDVLHSIINTYRQVHGVWPRYIRFASMHPSQQHSSTIVIGH